MDKNSDLKPGDILSRRKGLIMHKGILLDDGSVYHNTPRRGEHISSFSAFSKNRNVYAEPSDEFSREEALWGAKLYPKQRYNPLTNNCEHTVSRAANGNQRSPQLSSIFLSSGIAVATLVLTRSITLAGAGYALTRKFTKQNLKKSSLVL